ncbi:hypothetical protein LTR27_009950 [Elasticomyces elasticus]|nr:hypothetical protein LTR27_009950 [Elasticomyces elasticus]
MAKPTKTHVCDGCGKTKTSKMWYNQQDKEGNQIEGGKVCQQCHLAANPRTAETRVCDGCGKTKSQMSWYSRKDDNGNKIEGEKVCRACFDAAKAETRVCDGCGKTKSEATWYASKDEDGNNIEGGKVCRHCYDADRAATQPETRVCDSCGKTKSGSGRWYPWKDDDGNEIEGEKICRLCYDGANGETRLCNGCGKTKSGQWFARKDEDGFEIEGGKVCEACRVKSYRDIHGTPRTRVCDGCGKTFTMYHWYLQQDKDGNTIEGGKVCGHCHKKATYLESRVCDGCGKTKIGQWYTQKDDDGNVIEGRKVCEACYSATYRATRKLIDLEQSSFGQAMHELTNGIIQAGYNSFFNNSRLPHPETLQAQPDPDAVASPPYTKLATFKSGPKTVTRVVHDSSTLPERDNSRLEQALLRLQDNINEAMSRMPQELQDELEELNVEAERDENGGDSVLGDQNLCAELEALQIEFERLDADEMMPHLGDDEWFTQEHRERLPMLSRGGLQDVLTQAALQAQFAVKDPEPLGIATSQLTPIAKTALAAGYLKMSASPLDLDLHGDRTYLQPNVKVGPSKGPVMIGAVRTSGVVPQIVVNRLHVENQIVRNNFYQARRHAEQQDPALPVVPDFATYHSLVYNGISAADPFPVYWAPNQSWEQQQFIQILAQAAAQAREVIVLVRGIPGQSVFPNVYARIHQRWPNLVVRIAYALRPHFIANYNCVLAMLQPHRLPNPFRLHITLPTARNLYHSRLINIWDLEDQFVGNLQSQTIGQLLEWHDEEERSRTGGMQLFDEVTKVGDLGMIWASK